MIKCSKSNTNAIGDTDCIYVAIATSAVMTYDRLSYTREGRSLRECGHFQLSYCIHDVKEVLRSMLSVPWTVYRPSPAFPAPQLSPVGVTSQYTTERGTTWRFGKFGFSYASERYAIRTDIKLSFIWALLEKLMHFPFNKSRLWG